MTTPIQAELQRAVDTLGTLAPWLLTPDASSATGFADPIIEARLRFLFGSTATPARVGDDYQDSEILADQTGAGAVLTFTFTSAVNLIVVEAVGSGAQVARVSPGATAPTATKGFRADDGIPLFLPCTTSTVQVFAPASMAVAVNGLRRA